MATLFQCSSSAGADFVFNLPVASGSGSVGVIVKIDSNAHNIAVTPNGTDTINGVNAAVNVSVQWDSVTIVDVGSGAWVTI